MIYAIRNAIKTPDGTILDCKTNHDYQSHTDAVTGEFYMNDGLGYYIRRSINKVPAEDLSVTSEDSFDLQRLYFLWGTYGKTGGTVKKQVPLKFLSDQHISAILETQSHIKGTYVEDLFKKEQAYRAMHEINVEDSDYANV